MPKLCTNCKYEDADMNEWPCSMCDDISYGYGPNNMWEVKDDEPKTKECSFCWSLQANKEEIPGKKKFGIKLIINTFKDDEKYNETYLVGNKYDLNYCPVCGKEIKE